MMPGYLITKIGRNCKEERIGMKKKISIGIIIAAALIIVLFVFTKNPIVSCNIEIPESYMEAVKEQAKGVYQKNRSGIRRKKR